MGFDVIAGRLVVGFLFDVAGSRDLGGGGTPVQESI